VEKSDYNLLETLAQMILDIVIKNHLIVWAKVKVDKPFALRIFHKWLLVNGNYFFIEVRW